MKPSLSGLNFTVLFLIALLVTGASAGFAWAIIVKPTEWARRGGQAGAALGQSAAPAGDIDGNGIGDLLAGAPGHDTGLANCGAAYLYRAGPDALSTWSFFGTQASAAFGSAVSSAGDINGDGFDDFLVGSPLYDGGGGADQGRVDLYLGALNQPALPSQTLLYDVAGGQFGASLAPAGDIDGDGYDDVVIGAPRTTETQPEEGAVYVFMGGPFGLSGPTWIKHGGSPGAHLGFAVSGAGDVDADGFADLVVGAPGKSVSFVADGAAFVYRGSAAGVLAVASASLHGASDSAAFGAAVSLPGDTNADGYADVLIGAPNHRIAGTPYGEATLYSGAPGGLGAVLYQDVGDAARENYGVTVATLGDLNGDGYADFGVAADRWPQPSERRGRIEILLGAAVAPEVHVEEFGLAVGDALGFALATAGDLDSDGFADLVVGEPGVTDFFAGEGRLRLFRGSANPPVLADGWPAIESAPDAWFGSAVVGGLDPFGTRSTLLCIGAPGADPGFNDAGRAWRTTSTYPTTALFATPITGGTRAGMQLGATIAHARDVDGDRFEDLLVGSPGYGNGEGAEGLAQVYRGSAGGFVLPAAWSYEPNLVGVYAGTAVAAGDFNGDGYGDVLVASLYDGLSPGPTGFAKAFYGSAVGLPAVPSWATQPLAGVTLFATRVATGDWDCDGFTDAAVAAPGESHPETGEGRVYVYFGGPGGLDLSPGWVVERNLHGAQFGSALANGGDIDGDGVGDLIVGAAGAIESSHPTSAGEVWVLLGNRSRAKPKLHPDRMFVADASTISFGSAVAGVGDIDKDGFADFIVGAPQYSNGQADEGRVWLFRGSSGGGVKTPWWSAESDQAGASFGTALAGVGDCNDDGWPDFAVGAPFQAPGGAVYLYQGGGRPVYGRTAQETTVGPLPHGGRIGTPDDLRILHTVRSPAGRVKMRVEIHVATQDQAWSGGSNGGPAQVDTGAPGPGTHGSAKTLSLPYAALTPGVAYRFRVRNRPDAPYFAPTPWSQPRSLESAEPDFRVGGTIVAAGDPPVGLGARVALRSIEPSPFRTGVRIRYRLARAGVVALDLYDAAGRHVRRLAAGRQDSGDHDVAFDGREGNGQAVAAGVYFAVLELDGERDTRKFVRLP